MPEFGSTSTTGSDEVQLVSFKVDKETFAVPVHQVREIGKVEKITKVPKMPSFIEGVMNLRGQITTIIDMRRRFAIDTNGGRTTSSRIIVAEIGETQIGIIVDSVQDVIKVPGKSILPPPETIITKLDARFLTGICTHTEHLMMVIDLTNILNVEELEQVVGVTEDALEESATEDALEESATEDALEESATEEVLEESWEETQ